MITLAQNLLIAISSSLIIGIVLLYLAQKHGSKMAKSILRIIAVLLFIWPILMGVYNNYIVPKLTKQEVINSQPEIKNLEEGIATDETADWETYTNTQYGFEIKYPKECGTEKEESNPLGEDYPVCDYIACGWIRIRICINSNPLVYRQGVAKWVDEQAIELEIQRGDTKKEEKSIGNALFYEYYTVGYGRMAASRKVDALARHPSKNYYIIISSPELSGFGEIPDEYWESPLYNSITKEGKEWVLQDMEKDTSVKLFNQILSTFKFIE